MFSFSPSQGLVKYIVVGISWVMVGNYVKRKKNDAWWKDGQNCKRWKRKKKKEKREREKKKMKSVPLCL